MKNKISSKMKKDSSSTAKSTQLQSESDGSKESSGKLHIVTPEQNEKCSKKRKSKTKVDSDEEEEQIDFALEEKLQECARRNNLSPLEIKKILKKIVVNDHVLALVKIQEEDEIAKEKSTSTRNEEDKSTQGKVDEEDTNVCTPKLTRSKARALNKKPFRIPVLNEAEVKPEIKALITEEFPDEEDEEYRPGEEDIASDDEPNTTPSDVNSQPRTPMNQLQADGVDTSPQTQYSKDGLFKVPSELHNDSVASQQEEIIAKRTRSKLCLQTTPIEAIESNFVPPDVPRDMYELDVEMDQAWMDFLKEFSKPLNAHAEEDDEADPEYVAVDQEPIDREELREVNIPRKELNDLISELLEGFDDSMELTNDHQTEASLMDFGHLTPRKKNKVSDDFHGLTGMASLFESTNNQNETDNASSRTASVEDLQTISSDINQQQDNITAFNPDVMSTPNQKNGTAYTIQTIGNAINSQTLINTTPVNSNATNCSQKSSLQNQVVYATNVQQLENSSHSLQNQVVYATNVQQPDSRNLQTYLDVTHISENSSYIQQQPQTSTQTSVYTYTQPIVYQAIPIEPGQNFTTNFQSLQNNSQIIQLVPQNRPVHYVQKPTVISQQIIQPQSNYKIVQAVPTSAPSNVLQLQTYKPSSTSNTPVQVGSSQSKNTVCSQARKKSIGTGEPPKPRGRKPRTTPVIPTSATYHSYEIQSYSGYKSLNKIMKEEYLAKHEALKNVKPIEHVFDKNLKGFTNEQRLILDQQMRMSVQFALQNFLQTFCHPQLWALAEKHKQILLDLESKVNGRTDSAFNAWNLQPALDLMREWEQEFSVCNEENKDYVDFLKREIEKAKARRKYNTTYTVKFPPRLMKKVVSSLAFVYPSLLPKIPFRMDYFLPFQEFIPGEEHLLAFGMEKAYIELKAKSRYSKSKQIPVLAIARHISKHTTVGDKNMRRVYLLLRDRLGEPNYNPIKYFMEHKKAPPFEHNLIPFDADNVLTPEEQMSDLPAVWWNFVNTSKIEEQTTVQAGKKLNQNQLVQSASNINLSENAQGYGATNIVFHVNYVCEKIGESPRIDLSRTIEIASQGYQANESNLSVLRNNYLGEQTRLETQTDRCVHSINSSRLERFHCCLANGGNDSSIIEIAKGQKLLTEYYQTEGEANKSASEECSNITVHDKQQNPSEYEVLKDINPESDLNCGTETDNINPYLLISDNESNNNKEKSHVIPGDLENREVQENPQQQDPIVSDKQDQQISLPNESHKSLPTQENSNVHFDGPDFNTIVNAVLRKKYSKNGPRYTKPTLLLQKGRKTLHLRKTTPVHINNLVKIFPRKTKYKKLLKYKIGLLYVKLQNYIQAQRKRYTDALLSSVYMYVKSLEQYTDLIRVVMMSSAKKPKEAEPSGSDEASSTKKPKLPCDNPRTKHMKKVREQIKRMLLPDTKEQMNYKDAVFALNFFDKVEEIFTKEGKRENFTKFQKTLKNFDPQRDRVVDLYYKMENLFLPDHPELSEIFLTFLLPGEAIQVGKFFKHFMITNMSTFIDKLNVYFDKQPGHIKQVYSCLEELSNEDDVTIDKIKAKILPLIKGNKFLVDWFLQVFSSERPPDSLLTDYETVQINNNDIICEECETLSYKDLMPDTSEYHSCQIKYLNGRIFYGSRVVLPTRLSFLARQLTKSEEIRLNPDKDERKLGLENKCVHSIRQHAEKIMYNLPDVDDKSDTTDENCQKKDLKNKDYDLCDDNLFKAHAARLNPALYSQYTTDALMHERQSSPKKSARERRRSPKKNLSKSQGVKRSSSSQQSNTSNSPTRFKKIKKDKEHSFHDTRTKRRKMHESPPLEDKTPSSINDQQIVISTDSAPVSDVISVAPTSVTSQIKETSSDTSSSVSNIPSLIFVEPETWTREEDKIILETVKFGFETETEFIESLRTQLTHRSEKEISKRHKFLMDVLSQLKSKS